MRIGLLILLGLAVSLPADAASRLKKPKRGFQMRVDKYAVQPGEDLEVCEYRRLPNKKAMDVSGFELRMPRGAHHFVIWRYGGDIQDDRKFPAGPVPSVACAGLSPDEVIPQVMIPIQTPNSRFDFPEGVALSIDPREQVWLNPHMKNGDGAAMKPDVRFNFYAAKPGTVVHRAEGLIIGNTFDIHIPPGGEQTLTAEWTAPVDLTLIQLSTHQHRLGTYANIELVAPDGVTRSKIYENDSWEHPWPYWPKPAIHLVKGQKMRITCRWHNTDDHEVRFGAETTDEMCFILGFYYRDGNEPIINGQCIAAKRGLLCPLAPAVTD